MQRIAATPTRKNTAPAGPTASKSPFAVAEPLKLLGLLMMAGGRARTGLVVFGFAHLVSFLLVERIYHAGRDKLLTYGWLAWTMALLDRLRRRALGYVFQDFNLIPTLTALESWMPSEVLLLGGTPTLGTAVEAYRSC